MDELLNDGCFWVLASVSLLLALLLIVGIVFWSAIHQYL